MSTMLAVTLACVGICSEVLKLQESLMLVAFLLCFCGYFAMLREPRRQRYSATTPALADNPLTGCGSSRLSGTPMNFHLSLLMPLVCTSALLSGCTVVPGSHLPTSGKAIVVQQDDDFDLNNRYRSIACRRCCCRKCGA